MNTYLVTGAAGFIGSQLAKSLVGKGHRVVTIDNLSTGSKDCIPEGVLFIQGDCQDLGVLKQLEAYTFDTIFHIAGQSSGEISFEDPIYDLQTNTQSTLMLLKYCIAFGCKKFIYASTMSVYGDQEKLPVTENVLPTPKSLYGVGKLASEHYLRIYANYGIQTTALRLFNVYGPGQNLTNLKQGMVSIYLAQAINSGQIVVKGAPDRFRDFVYIDDVVNAFLDINKMPFVSGYEVFNVCSCTKTTVGELLNFINEHFGNSLKINFTSSTPGDQFGIVGSNEKLTKSSGWQSTTLFSEGLTKMINWARSQE